MRYFDPDNRFQGYSAWPVKGLGDIQEDLKVQVVGGMVVDNHSLGEQYDQAGLTNFGKLDKIAFYDHLSRASVLIGIGKPRVSPSAYDGLCLGVPVRLSRDH
jgi:hypothetical protein